MVEIEPWKEESIGKIKVKKKKKVGLILMRWHDSWCRHSILHP